MLCTVHNNAYQDSGISEFVLRVFHSASCDNQAHALRFAAGSLPLLLLSGSTRCRGQASTVMSEFRSIDGRGIHVCCKYDLTSRR